MKAETFDGEEEVGWWTPDGRQTHVGPPQHWDRDQVLLLLAKVANLLLETVVELLLVSFSIILPPFGINCDGPNITMVIGTVGREENHIVEVWVPVGSV